MQPRTVKLGAMLTSLIQRGGYSRNRQVILAAVGVSAAALSQYARDENRPSFQRLVALADFFGVSLDYLVFGEPTPRKTVDHSPLARHVDRALAEAQTRANRHAALVARIGRVLADRVSDIAWQVAGSQLHAQVRDHVDDDRWLGYVTRTNAVAKSDMLLGRQQVTAARNTFDALWATSDPL